MGVEKHQKTNPKSPIPNELLLIPPKVAQPTVAHRLGMSLFEFSRPTADDFRTEISIGIGIVNRRVIPLIRRATLWCKQTVSRNTPGHAYKDKSEDARD